MQDVKIIIIHSCYWNNWFSWLGVSI